jgi:hypothetical protein
MPLLETKGAASAQGFGGAGAGASGPVTYIEDVFSTYLYTGNGSTQTITNGIDLSGKGGLVWAKSRSTITFHDWEDTVRGAGNAIYSNSSNASDYSANRITSFNSDGYSLGSIEPNFNNRTYASWTFRKQPKFFDVVTYTGTGSTPLNISHNLGSVPGCVIIKNTSNSGYDWWVYHRSLTTPNNYRLILNGTNAQYTPGYQLWSVNSTTLTISTSDGDVNATGNTYVAYLFAHNAGGFGLTGSDNVISCGSCSVGDTINLGYEPQWILAKRTDTTGDWYIDDNMRGWPAAGANDNPLLANSSAAEPTGYAGFSNITSTGFTCNFNGSYIYIAIRRGPMKVPTDTTTVFKVNYPGSYNDSTLLTVGFPSDEVLYVPFLQNNGSKTPIWYARLMGSYALMSASTAGETGYGSPTFANQTQFAPNYAGSAGVAVLYSFRRAPSFFDVVCYTGTGSATTQTHNLGVAPELMIVKSRSSSVYDWRAYSATLGATQYLTPNTTQSGAASSTSWNDTAPTASVFTVGSSAVVNGSGGTYVAYLFTSCPGVSKVGSYTGTGTTLQIDCGFTGGAKFVLIKRTDSTGNWWVWDTSRGMVAGTDPRFPLNSLDRDSNNNWVYTNASGFEIVTTDSTVNANGGTYIFLAIA